MNAILRKAGGAVVVGAYLLTLITQVPHIYDVYNGLERQTHTVLGTTLSTAWGAAIAFEISVAIFTWRLIVNTSAGRSRWTRRGVLGFLVLSFVANLAYYFDWRVGPVSLDDGVMPFLLAAALPLALWLYAEEFGAEAGHAVRAAERQKRREQKAEPVWSYDPRPYVCWCGEWAPDPKKHKTESQARGGLGAHAKRHRAEVKKAKGASPSAVRRYFETRYAESRAGKDLADVPELWRIGEWMNGGKKDERPSQQND